MDDERIRDFETSLWIGGEDIYRRSIDSECLMVVPAAPFVMSGSEAIEAVSRTPRWESVEFDDLRIGRPQEGLIVLAYGVRASRAGEAYGAYCTSTYRRVAHEQWQVVQHQQTLVPAMQGQGETGAIGRAQEDATQAGEGGRGYQ